MINKKSAFTLTELLIALGIIGTVAAISIPSLMNTINNRILATQLKSNIGSIQQLVSDQMVMKKTKNLADADFGNPTTLLSESNFATTKICTPSEAISKCWGGVTKYKNIANRTETVVIPTYRTLKLKNGAMISYVNITSTLPTGDPAIGRFYIDINGTELPNMVGRDYFSFYVTKTGKIIGNLTNVADATLITNCKNGDPVSCYEQVTKDGWNITY